MSHLETEVRSMEEKTSQLKDQLLSAQKRTSELEFTVETAEDRQAEISKELEAYKKQVKVAKFTFLCLFHEALTTSKSSKSHRSEF